MSSIPGSKGAWRRCVAWAGLVVAVTAIGGARGVAQQPGPDDHGHAAGADATDGANIRSRTPRTPGPPQRLTSAGLRPLTEDEDERLTGGRSQGGPTCDIDFDDDGAIGYLLDHAADTFAYSPWWNQRCGGNYAHVFPTDGSHFHLGYVDSTIGPCWNLDNPYDTPAGQWSRGEDCEPVDHMTEPRSEITTHYPWNHIHLDLYDPSAPDYAQRPFTLELARIMHAAVRVCYRMPPTGPWESAGPVGPFDHPGPVYCWPNLAPGLWDLSTWTVGTMEVSFTDAVGDTWMLDDLRLS